MRIPLPPRCGISAAVFERAAGKMLAALQHVRKQTRAPNDSNKPGHRLPLRLRPAGTGGRAAPAAERGTAGKRGAAGSGGAASSGRAGRCPLRPAGFLHLGAPPGHAGHPRHRLCPSAAPGPAGSPRGVCGALACAPLLSPPHRPLRRARGRGKVGIYSCLGWGL